MANSDDQRASRRRLLLGLGGAALAMPWACARSRPGATAAGAWDAWEVLVQSSLSGDGRLIDRNHADLRSTSEGQSYALFFALADGDRERFDLILQWTRNNLADGDLGKRLPAWLWGRHEASGQWRVLDANAASDSDLWIAYVLLEAGRLWRRPALDELGRRMLALIRRQEVVELPGLGSMLLPGPHGFAHADHWRLNPSYLPLPLLRRFAQVDADGPWQALARNTARLLHLCAPHGFAPDWVAWREGRVAKDPVKGAVGSYDAIRTYLWAGMTHPADPEFRRILATLHGPLALLQRDQPMPESVDTRTGATHGRGPWGFDAAMLPWLQAQGQRQLARRLRARLPTPDQQRAAAPAYYSQVLGLFGAGWFDGRWRFGPHGELQPRRRALPG